MNRFPGLLALLLSLFAASPSFGRVISYAPYTNRTALASIHDRATRYFVLIEGKQEDFFHSSPRDVVLYDASGAEEPRVITPSPGVWQQTALYQPGGGAPLILAVKRGNVMISEGGTGWRTVLEGSAINPDPVRDIDTGGPHSGGLFVPILLGNDEWPFVVTLRDNGVWAIRRNGEAKRLVEPNNARLAGRNAAGDRFLVQIGTAIWTTAPDGTSAKLADLPANGTYAGWLTANGTAYLERLFITGRALYLARGSSIELVAAGPDVAVDANVVLPPRTFAIPTHDYEGAWIVKRAPGQPTSLSRHTPAGGVELMWSDELRPEVEALIAGKSGQTVLVQVHRDRPGADALEPIIDPALAVWRVGQPAPRDYDELYLNEQWNKGFVVMDPDKPDPFVFDSGYRTVALPSPSRVSAPIGGGSAVVQEWGVVRGTFAQRLVLPGVARLRGAYDSFWQTDVIFHNPLAVQQKVDVRYAPLGEENGVSTTLTLEPDEIRAVPDVLRTLFFLESGGGSLHLVPEAGINATARTYTRRGSGTYGYGMQAIDASTAAGPRFPLTFSGAFPDENFRTNVLLTDTSGRGTHATLLKAHSWGYDEDSGALATHPSGATQTTLEPPDRLYYGTTLVVEPTRGTAIATVVAIDNRSNDPTWFPPDLPGTIARAIPVIGHLDGANGTQWRSDLYLHNPREGTRYLIVTATLWADPSRDYVRWVYLNGRQTYVVRDALRTLFGLDGVARIKYVSDEDEPGEGVRVSSRTYTVDANGATYGSLVPALNGFQIAAPHDRLEILGAGGGPGFRTNIGLVDLSDGNTKDALVRITIVGDRRQVLSTFFASVPRRGGVQLNDVFRARGIPTPAAAMLVIENVDGELITAYATLVDNVTNDSTYLAPQLAAKL